MKSEMGVIYKKKNQASTSFVKTGAVKSILYFEV
jgi:hypothetical protein